VGQAILPAAAFPGGVLLLQRNSPRRLHKLAVKHYERRLPHWDVVGQPVFVTFRLHGTLPASRVFPPERMSSGKAFVAMDRILDGARHGPTDLGMPEIAELVVNALFAGECKFRRYELHAFVVMQNHVHILVTPSVPSTKWLGPLKGFTAHAANLLLGTTGTPFWQDESYDHLVRDDREFGRIRDYIEWDPVKAGLVDTVEKFRWSSAWTGPPERRLQPGLAAPLGLVLKVFPGEVA
jgi:putative transposase